MSGYYLLLHVLIGLLGNGEVVLRLPSVIATAATAGLRVLRSRCVCSTGGSHSPRAC